MNKANRNFANLCPVPLDQVIDLTLPKRELYALLVGKYGKEINELNRLDHRFWSSQDEDGQRMILIILEKLRIHSEFGQSQPPIDLKWILDMLTVFRMEEIRAGLNKAALWISSNPERKKKNYRRFLLNWITTESDRGKREVHYHVNQPEI